MRILVAVEAYPDLEGGVNLYYVHERNLSYMKNGVSVTVLNFSAEKNYVIDGISVITHETYKKSAGQYGKLLILHAANLRHHHRFLRLYGRNFEKYIFFFHGHEVLRCSKVYPEPYKYVKQNKIKEKIKDCYDIFKLKVWKHTFTKIYKRSEFVFVSYWMYNEFMKWVKIDKKYIEGRYHIIYNCVGKDFELESYDWDREKKYDILSIRSNFDGSKYGVDIICKIAKQNPDVSFCLVGKGDYFKYHQKPVNIEIISEYLSHEKMVRLFDLSKCVLMPTRTDAQGVMACEMATYGIPLITSDIPVCREVFSEFENVAYVSNKDGVKNIGKVYEEICKRDAVKNEKYFAKNTNMKEIELIKEVYHG